MIISCSRCETSYEVEPSYFEPDGRKVKCSSCGTVWFQGYIRPEDIEAFEESHAVEDPQEKFEEVEEGDIEFSEGDDNQPDGDIKTEAHRLVAAAKQKNAGRTVRNKRIVSIMKGWGTLAAAILLFAGISVYYRINIVKTFPASAQLYEWLDMPVNVRGMSFANVVYKNDFENGLPILAIKGEVVNLTNEQKTLPRVRLGLVDATNRELYHWSVRVDNKPLGPNGRVKFVTRLASPPAGAQGLVVRFAKATSGYGVYR